MLSETENNIFSYTELRGALAQGLAYRSAIFISSVTESSTTLPILLDHLKKQWPPEFEIAFSLALVPFQSGSGFTGF